MLSNWSDCSRTRANLIVHPRSFPTFLKPPWCGIRQSHFGHNPRCALSGYCLVFCQIRSFNRDRYGRTNLGFVKHPIISHKAIHSTFTNHSLEVFIVTCSHSQTTWPNYPLAQPQPLTWFSPFSWYELIGTRYAVDKISKIGIDFSMLSDHCFCTFSQRKLSAIGRHLVGCRFSSCQLLWECS